MKISIGENLNDTLNSIFHFIGMILAGILLFFGCFFLELGYVWQGNGIIMTSLFLVMIVQSQIIIHGFNNALKEHEKRLENKNRKDN